MISAKILIALGIALSSVLSTSFAQRADERPVMTPPPRQQTQASRDIVPDFGVIYRSAGSPKVVLLWNRTLSDQSQTAIQQKKVSREVGMSSASRTEKSTAGAAGNMSTRDDDSKFDKTKTETSMSVAVSEPLRRIALEERHAVMVERAFVAEMNRAGVNFVDRALAMRSTAASTHRSGGDQQLIETDAIQKYADLLMEVLWIEDKEAPAGYAFDVRTKNLKTGQEISSVYTQGFGPPPPPREGGWVAGKVGYEYAQPPPAPAPSPANVGASVSHDVMRTLGGVLALSKPDSKKLVR